MNLIALLILALISLISIYFLVAEDAKRAKRLKDTCSLSFTVYEGGSSETAKWTFSGQSRTDISRKGTKNQAQPKDLSAV